MLLKGGENKLLLYIISNVFMILFELFIERFIINNDKIFEFIVIEF